MSKLIAKKDMRYASRDLRAGAEFDASDKDAEILRAVGHAEDAQEMSSDSQPSLTLRKPRTYKRRDMQAED